LSIETGRKEAGPSGNMGVVLDVQKFAVMWTGLKRLGIGSSGDL